MKKFNPIYTKYELQYSFNNELFSIELDYIEFKLLLNNIPGQTSLLNKMNPEYVLQELVTIHRNKENVSVMLKHNSKDLFVFPFYKEISYSDFMS